MNMNREQLIRSIETARVKGVVVPTEVFGRKIFVKTTKHDLVAQIRNEFKEAQPTNMRFRVDEASSLAIVEPATGKRGGKIHEHLKAEPGVPVPKRGRPFSKNPDPNENKVVPMRKASAPRAQPKAAAVKKEDTPPAANTQSPMKDDPNLPSTGDQGSNGSTNGNDSTQH